MPKRLMLVVAVVFVVLSALGTAIAVGQGGSDDVNNDTLTAKLSGRNESPAGDTDGKGAAAVVVDGRRVCISISFADLTRAVAAHIHKAPRGQNGGIVVDPKFSPKSGGANTFGGCVQVAQAVASDIKRNPAGYYVNVHTQDFAGGAIRGQLRR